MVKEFPPFRLDDVDQSLWREGRRIRLTPKAYALLHYLVAHAGRLATQEELLQALWPDTFVQPEVLKSQILDVRAALGDRHKDPSFIETVPRRGYRFIAPVYDAAGASPPRSGESPQRPHRHIVGRRAALDVLQASFAKAREGERQVLFVTGEQGIGKSTTVEVFLDRIDSSSATLLRAQCLESFGTTKEPYYPLLEALGHFARSSAEILADTLSRHGPTWLMRFPALVQPGDREHLQRELVGTTPGRMIREMCEVLEQLAERRPLVLFLEDLHWSDHATVDVLVALARRRLPARLLLIGTYRPVDLVLAQHPLKAACHSLRVNRVSQDIALSPLDEADVADYLAGSTASGAEVTQLAHWVRKQTDGNPLFMVTVLDHLLERGHILRDARDAFTIAMPLEQIGMAVPETLSELIELQLDRLSPTQKLVLDAASVHGVMFSATVTASVLEMDLEAVEDVCFELARNQHVIRNADVEHLDRGLVSQRFEFIHATFRNVCYQRLSPARKAKLHRRFADSIERLAGERRGEHAVELAGHFERCGEWGRTIEFLQRVAQDAWKRFEYREAVATLERALQAASHLPDGERGRAETAVLWMLAVCLQALHDAPRVIPTLEAVATRAAAWGLVEPEVRAILAAAFFRSREDAGACGPLLEQAERLIAGLAEGSVRHELAATASVARITLLGWDPAAVQRHGRHWASVKRSNDRLATATTQLAASQLLWLESKYHEGLQSARDALGPMLESGRLVLYFHGHEMVATNLRMLGRWGESLDVLDEAIDSARRNESGSRLAMALVLKAHVHLEALDFQGVLDMCAEAAPWLEGPFIRDRKYVGLQLAAAATLGLGREDDALSRLLDIRRAMDERPVALSWYWRLPLQISLAEGWLAKGDGEKARSDADAALTLAGNTGERTWQARAWAVSAQVALAERDHDRAKRDLAKGFAAIEGYDAPLAAWRLHATATHLGRRIAPGRSDHRRAGQKVVSVLATSLDSRPSLRETFLSSALVSPVFSA